jgi:hypothetical protein
LIASKVKISRRQWRKSLGGVAGVGISFSSYQM